MKQTAVQWLYEKILLTPLDIREINKCLEQAKAMEKEQIENALQWSHDYGHEIGYKWLLTKYYEQTYESKTNL